MLRCAVRYLRLMRLWGRFSTVPCRLSSVVCRLSSPLVFNVVSFSDSVDWVLFDRTPNSGTGRVASPNVALSRTGGLAVEKGRRNRVRHGSMDPRQVDDRGFEKLQGLVRVVANDRSEYAWQTKVTRATYSASKHSGWAAGLINLTGWLLVGLSWRVKGWWRQREKKKDERTNERTNGPTDRRRN
jgi:hypothetical protein